MDFSKILQPEIQQFISENGSVNINQLALKKNPFPEIPYSVLLNQIAAKQKAKDKLPTWYHANNIIYPEKISIEQTSSEITAKYKASLLSGTSVIDLTGGFGVDDYYFSKVVEKVTHCEINAELSEIVKHNCKQLQVDNMECFAGDSAVLLKDLNQKFDTIYIDPSRRNDAKGKVFMLADCLPNVVDLQDFYFTYSNKILVKTAPILDIQAGLNELKNVKNIHIVAVENEVKELLWEIEKNWNSIPVITTINFEKNRVFPLIFLFFGSKYNNGESPIGPKCFLVNKNVTKPKIITIPKTPKIPKPGMTNSSTANKITPMKNTRISQLSARPFR